MEVIKRKDIKRGKMNKKLKHNCVGLRGVDSGSAWFVLFSLCFMAVLCVSSTSVGVFADTVDRINLNIEASCTLSTTGSGNYSAEVNPGVMTEITGNPINATCNDPGGYSLYAVGFSGNSYTINNTKLLSSIDSSYDIATGNSGSDSYWAMKVAGSGTNSPTIANSYDTYQVIPSHYTLISHYDSLTTGTSITTPTYKVNLAANQVADTYTGKVKYTLVNPHLDSATASTLTMQEANNFTLNALMPNSGDTATLYDARDGNDYEITNIGDTYWMTQNLRITNTTGQSTGTILAEGSNFDSDVTFSGDLTNGNSYSAMYYHVPTETDLTTLGLTAKQVGVFYNFCAASAGTVCDNATQENSSADICPAGWRLPNKDELTAAVNYLGNFDAFKNGYYASGKLTTTYAYYWSSTARDAIYQYRLRYNGSALQNSYVYKYYGNSIRCVKEPDYTNVTVNFAGSGIAGVQFTNNDYGTETVTASGNIVSLKVGATYTMTATLASGGTFTSWYATDGAIGSATTNPTTYVPTGAATITAAGGNILEVNFNTLNAYGVMLKTGSLTGANAGVVTTPGSIVEITPGTNYYLIPLYKSKYTFNSWTATGGTATTDNNNYGYSYYTATNGLNKIKLATSSLGTTSSIIMQNMAASSCTSKPTAVKDSRDNAVYYIQRLADGQCWMLENLRLGHATTTYTLTSANTNVADGYSFTLPASTTTCFTADGNCDGSGDSTHTGYTVAAINADSKTTTKTGYGSSRQYVGVYYNFCAASAGTYCMNGSTNGGNASYDVCPAGWKIPIDTTAAGGYDYLYKTGYSSHIKATQYSLNTTLAGWFYNGAAVSQGTYGVYHSSTRYSNTSMYRFYNKSSSITSRYTKNNRVYGYPVRCVLKQ